MDRDSGPEVGPTSSFTNPLSDRTSDVMRGAIVLASEREDLRHGVHDGGLGGDGSPNDVVPLRQVNDDDLRRATRVVADGDELVRFHRACLHTHTPAHQPRAQST